MNKVGVNFFAYLEMPLNSLPCHWQPFSAKLPRLELKTSIKCAFKMFGPTASYKNSKLALKKMERQGLY